MKYVIDKTSNIVLAIHSLEQNIQNYYKNCNIYNTEKIYNVGDTFIIQNPTVSELWQAAQNYYSGIDQPEASRLAKSQTDAYQLGITNYNRRLQGKQVIGSVIINPDNYRMLANLSWGQQIWSDYYQRLYKMQSGQQITADFSNHGDKPYTFTQVLQLELSDQSDSEVSTPDKY